jgi:hypothetical protein
MRDFGYMFVYALMAGAIVVAALLTLSILWGAQ